MEVTEERVNSGIRNTLSYLVLYLLIGLLAKLYNTYFFIGNDLVSILLELYPIWMFILFAYLFILLILKVIYNFIKSGTE